MKKRAKLAVFAAGLMISATGYAQTLPNPNAIETERGRNNPCADPWVSYAVSVAKSKPGFVGRAGGSGNSGECDIKLYNGGRWGSYDELVRHARATYASLVNQNVQFLPDGKVGVIDLARGLNPDNIISTNAGAIISGGAGNIISGGAGNIISGGAGNVVGGPGNFRVMNDDGARAKFKLPNGAELRVR